MTQPVQEPNLHRTDARLSWGQNQLFRRPAPSAASELNSFAYLDHSFIGTVVTDTWTDAVANDPYDEAVISDPDEASFDADTVTGCISWNNPGYYWALAWARLNGGPTAGNTYGVAIVTGNDCTFASRRFANSVVGDGMIDATRITVVAPVWDPTGVVGPDSVKMQVYHTEGSDLSFGDAQLHVFRVTGADIIIHT